MSSVAAAPGPAALNGRGLEGMLQSDLFDVPMCIEHLFRHQDADGIKQFRQLLDRLRQFTLGGMEVVEAYLPQLVNLLLRGPQAPLQHAGMLELFLLEGASRSIHFALLLAWQLDSESADPLLHKRALELKDQAERCAVNAALPRSLLASCQQVFSDQLTPRPTSPTSDELERETRMKDCRCQYFNDMSTFISQLCDLSHRLSEEPREKRNDMLRAAMRDWNERLPKMTVAAPIGRNSSDGFAHLVGVRKQVVFSSRERAPYMVWFEAVGSGGTFATPELPARSVTRRLPRELSAGTASVDVEVLGGVIPGGAGAVHSVRVELTGGPAAGRRVAAERQAHPLPGAAPQWGETFRGIPVPHQLSALRFTVVRQGERAKQLCSFEQSLWELRGADGGSLCDDRPWEHTYVHSGSGVQLSVRLVLHGVRSPDGADDSSPANSPQARVYCADGPTVREDHFAQSLSSSPVPDESEHERAEAMRRRLDAIFGPTFEEQKEAERRKSPFGDNPTWTILPVIIKAGDDMRQEVLAMQIIKCFDSVWREGGLPICLFPYHIMVTSDNAGIIELITDAKSIDSIKKDVPEAGQSLAGFWTHAYGSPDSAEYRKAQRNFVESMAGYSIITYLLQIKDRHNANIMLKRDGRVVHIDFGFMLTNSPGGMNMESMPFKLTQEYVDVMGGTASDMFQYYRVLIFAGFREARKHRDRIVSLVEEMVTKSGRFPPLPCFGGDPRQAIEELKERFALSTPEQQLAAWVRDAIDQSVDNWRARNYDRFQRWQNGIL
eukprot:TRINITY_DN19159_c0_g1_i1.p1 TRINITY_DN19159_c0_g1~~TRINITY_DN19159_c0_g1_i1.p1  ORF type:complete len:778 (+),score=267.06 TRINITY_DN19159_c0_g1_i1:90-2423(+)